MKTVDRALRRLGLYESTAGALFLYLSREVGPLIGRMHYHLNELLADTDTTIDEAHTAATFSWNAYNNGSAYIQKTSGAALAVSYDTTFQAVADLPEGRTFTLVVYNNTGGNCDVTFGANFLANGATLSDGETGTWCFQVAHADWVLARIVQIGDTVTL